MKKRIFINQCKPICKYREIYETEYHDGFVDTEIYCGLCKDDKVKCNSKKCKKKEFEGTTKEGLINKVEKALKQYVTDNEIYTDKELAKIAVEVILGETNV